METPRQATKEELKELQEYLKREEREGWIEGYYFAVFDDYISDCPAYSGKLMTAVWGMPEFYEVYIWVNGKIKRAKIDEAFSSKGDMNEQG